MLRLSVFILMAVATLRIGLTYPVFSLTSDEPAHVACGLEWLEKGVYRFEAQHPPLARVMTAVLPYAAGSRLGGDPDMFHQGWDILNSGGTSGDRNLTLARLGILPFFWLATWMLYYVTRRYFGDMTALFATIFFTLLPPVLAHAGLATTDMALTATLGAAVYALLLWIEEPTAWRSLWLGVALASTIASKFSALAFLPAAAVSMLATQWVVARPAMRGWWGKSRIYLAPAGAVLVVACFCVWAVYRFSFDRYPAPELFAGIREVREHNQQGHLSFLLGQHSRVGFWYYYPVVLSAKTPLALILLFIAGVVIAFRRRRELGGRYLQPVAFAAALLMVGAFSRINIGVRHILPIYFAISICAAIAAKALWDTHKQMARAGVALLMIWMAVSSVASHPDYLAYFNELAGDRPERILVDSDLDWGQDWKRMAARLKQVGAAEVAVDPILVNNPRVLHGFPKLVPLDPDAPKPGWNVVDVSLLTLGSGMFHESPRGSPWAARIPPTERVGKTLLVWHIPE